jgi:Na+/proline symporter
MKTSNLALIGITFSLLGTAGAAYDHDWLRFFWAISSIGWAFLCYRISKREEVNSSWKL